MRKLWFGVIGVAVVLAFAACGGSDDSGDEAVAETVAATSAAESGGGAAAAGGQLSGTVGPGFTITLTQDGEPVSSLAAGSYEIVIDDKSSAHNFHLTGPNVDEATDVGETGTTTWTVDLEKGDYSFQCDPHAASMNGSFSVT